jgi:hypothetical protein
MFGQVVTYQAPLVGTPEGGQFSTLTKQSLGPSQTLSYLQAQQQLIGTRVYARRILPVVGQPYNLQMTDAQVMDQVYGGLPTMAGKPAAEGTDPQTVVRMKSGLEIPKYILNRQVARKKVEEAEMAALAAKKPPRFYKIGKYTEKNPAMASGIALVIGAIIGNAYFDLTR